MPDVSLPSAEEKLEFAWKIHSYVSDAVRLADAKASFLFASFSTSIAALFAARLHIRFTAVPARDWNLSAYTSLLAFILLAIGTLCAFWALRPRLWNSEGTGLIYWEDISKHGNPTHFARELNETNSDMFLDQISKHIFVLCQIVKSKFFWTFSSATVGIGGLILSSMILLFF